MDIPWYNVIIVTSDFPVLYFILSLINTFIFKFEADFAAMYPDYTLKIYSNFDDFALKAVNALQVLEKKCGALQDNLALIEDQKLSKGLYCTFFSFSFKFWVVN